MGELKSRDTKARCPKCGSRTFKVYYVDACEMVNDVVDGRWAGTFEDSAMPSRISANGKCHRCEHSWKFRNGYID